MNKIISKIILILLLSFSIILIGCGDKINKETCKGYCDTCEELNKETCKDYCDTCEELNKETCKGYCDTCEELNKETCKGYCDTCEELNKETCKDYCDTCEEINEETCKEFIPKKERVYLGIDLIEENLEIFKNKRVGLITNPTGVNSDYKSTIDVLFEKVDLKSLFAPEHGIRGNSQAGGSIGEEIDDVTGLKVYSLYGNTKKPTQEMMDTIDVLCIDIQDVGSRFYTYIYTMAYAMQACKEYGKTFVVFDRPNPISNKIDGNILEKYKSFVGMYEIITRHGMTIGELARMFNEKFNIGCDLKVIKMKNYDPTKYIDELIAPWVNPSPNMPTLDTALVYPGTCLFEGVNLSEGRGTTKPFEFIGAPFINAYAWAKKLNSLNLDGVVFRPIYFTPTFDDYKGQLCGGVQVHVKNRNTFSPTKTGVAMIYTVKEMYPSNVELQSYLKTLSGVDYIYNMSYKLEEVFKKIDNDIETFENISKPYKLY